MNPSHEKRQTHTMRFSVVSRRVLGAALILSIAVALFGLAAAADVAEARAEAAPSTESGPLYVSPELRLFHGHDAGTRGVPPGSCAASGGVCSPTILDYWVDGSLMV